MTTDEIDREVAKRCATVTPYSLADWEPIAREWRIAGHDPDRLAAWVIDNARSGATCSPELVASAIATMKAQVPPARPLTSSKPPTGGRLERAAQTAVLLVFSAALCVVLAAIAWRAVRWITGG
jgi:hypothetical protein